VSAFEKQFGVALLLNWLADLPLEKMAVVLRWAKNVIAIADVMLR